MPTVLVAMIEQLDVEQADILEGQPSYTNWEVVSALLPIGSLETLMCETGAQEWGKEEQEIHAIKQRSLPI